MRELTTTTMIIEKGCLGEVRVEGYVAYSIDRHYGEDADGNRGSSMIVVEDVEDISVYNDDGDKVSVSPEDIEAIADKLTIKFLER